MSCGMTPADALVATTRTAAELLGVEDDRGTVEFGHRADLLVIEWAIRSTSTRWVNASAPSSKTARSSSTTTCSDSVRSVVSGEGIDVDDLAALALAELDAAVDEREQRVVATDADVLAGVELGAALADDDRAGVDLLPPNTFTPRRWALESRPLRVEPPPLVLDMATSYFVVILVISTTCSAGGGRTGGAGWCAACR